MQERCGVGLGIGEVNGSIRVTRVVPGGSAARNGRVHPGDVLQAVDGVHVWTVEQATELMAGENGSTLALTFAKQHGGQPSWDIFAAAQVRTETLALWRQPLLLPATAKTIHFQAAPNASRGDMQVLPAGLAVVWRDVQSDTSWDTSLRMKSTHKVTGAHCSTFFLSSSWLCHGGGSVVSGKEFLSYCRQRTEEGRRWWARLHESDATSMVRIEALLSEAERVEFSASEQRDRVRTEGRGGDTLKVYQRVSAVIQDYILDWTYGRCESNL